MADTAFGVPPEKRDRLAASGSTAVPTSIASGPDHEQRVRGLGEGRQRSPRRVGVLPGRRSPMSSCAGGTVCSAPSATTFASPKCWPTAESLTARAFLDARPWAHMHLLDSAACPCPATVSALAHEFCFDVAQSGAPGRPGEFGWSGAAKTTYWVDPQEELVGLFMMESLTASTSRSSIYAPSPIRR